jgi:hypothetical protein
MGILTTTDCFLADAVTHFRQKTYCYDFTGDLLSRTNSPR